MAFFIEKDLNPGNGVSFAKRASRISPAAADVSWRPLPWGIRRPIEESNHDKKDNLIFVLLTQPTVTRSPVCLSVFLSFILFFCTKLNRFKVVFFSTHRNILFSKRFLIILFANPTFWQKNLQIRVAAIGPWFRLCLPSSGPGFESQALHLHFFNL